MPRRSHALLGFASGQNDFFFQVCQPPVKLLSVNPIEWVWVLPIAPVAMDRSVFRVFLNKRSGHRATTTTHTLIRPVFGRFVSVERLTSKILNSERMPETPGATPLGT